MQDEFTKKMHSEFAVDSEVEKRHKAICVWKVFENRYANQEIGEEEKKNILTNLGDLYEICYEDILQVAYNM